MAIAQSNNKRERKNAQQNTENIYTNNCKNKHKSLVKQTLKNCH